MANPNERDPQQGYDPFEEAGSHAADEPTAVWDADTLREAGLAELIEQEATVVSAPATLGAQSADPSIQVAEDLQVQSAGSARPLTEKPDKRSMGWGAALLIALVLGGAVYAAIRFLG